MERHLNIDYDIHGFVGIRLVNPSPQDLAAVAKQIGPLRGDLRRSPDITIRFEEKVTLENLRYLGLNSVGYTDDAFYILRSSKRSAKVRIDFSRIGEQVEIVCESGLKSVPLLMDILNLTLLKKNVVALHASAFRFRGQGVLVTGWAKGGKTEALLSFARHGAEYVGDEWIYVPADGQAMYGIPENIRLWDWHLDNLPHLRKQISFEKKAMFATIHFLEKVEKVLPRGAIGKFPPIKFFREAMPAFKRQLNVQLPPATIFERVSKSFSAQPDKLFLLLSQEASDYSVQEIDGEEIAQRMTASLRFEFTRFMEYYQAFIFAFPDKASRFIEGAHLLQRQLLTRALSGKDAYAVLHPYPLSFEKLYQIIAPYVVPGVNKTTAQGSNGAEPVATGTIST